MISVYFPAYYFEMGFALKGFIIFTLLGYCLFLNKITFTKLINGEIIISIFYLYLLATSIYAHYKDMSLRLGFLILISFMFYFLLRFLLLNLPISHIETIIEKAGLIFNSISLGLYTLGWTMFLNNPEANNITYFGLAIDRGIPRLQGTVQDPNLFVFFNLLFFFYFYLRSNNLLNFLGLFLSSLTIILSLSRGGILAIIICLVIDLLFYRTSKGKVKILTIGLVGFICLGTLLQGQLVGFNLGDLINERLTTIETDGASGRLEIWSNGWKLFMDNPLLGIGIYNFRPWNINFFSDYHYLHNTFLEVLVEGGIVGFVVWILGGMILLNYVFKIAKANPDHRYLLLTFIGVFISMQSISVLTNEAMLLFGVLIIRYVHFYKDGGVVD